MTADSEQQALGLGQIETVKCIQKKYAPNSGEATPETTSLIAILNVNARDKTEGITAEAIARGHIFGNCPLAAKKFSKESIDLVIK